MYPFSGKLAVLTDATTKIGFTIVEKLVNGGLHVVGLGTEVTRLEELSERLQKRTGTFQYFVTDLTREQDVINAINWANESIGPIHVVINNANVDLPSSIIDGRIGDLQKIFDTNVIGSTLVTREVTRSMIRNDVIGHVISIIDRNVYEPARHAVVSLLENLRQELKSTKSKIKVTSLYVEYVENVTGRCILAFNEDVANTLTYILSMPSQVQVKELVLSAV